MKSVTINLFKKDKYIDQSYNKMEISQFLREAAKKVFFSLKIAENGF